MQERYIVISGENVKSIEYQDKKIIIGVTGKGFRELAEQYHDLPIPISLEKASR